MRRLTQHDGRNFHAADLAGLEPLAPPFAGERFPCLVWDHVGGWSPEEKVEFAARLIAGGCRYAVCAGKSAKEWEDAFDLAFEREHADEPDDAGAGEFVMTTTHEGETPAEIAHFFVHCTNFEEHDFRSYLLLQLGRGPEASAIEDAIRRSAESGAPRLRPPLAK